MGSVTLNESALQKVAEDAREDALIHYAAVVVVFAQMLAPVGQTGHLRRSIERGDPQGGSRWILVVAGAFYSIFVERGTGIYAEGGRGRKTPWVYRDARGRFFTTEGMRKQPFLGPALDMAAKG